MQKVGSVEFQPPIPGLMNETKLQFATKSTEPCDNVLLTPRIKLVTKLNVPLNLSQAGDFTCVVSFTDMFTVSLEAGKEVQVESI
jgi:hypothetical protein